MQAQIPNSKVGLPLAGMQIEPITVVGNSKTTWRMVSQRRRLSPERVIMP